MSRSSSRNRHRTRAGAQPPAPAPQTPLPASAPAADWQSIAVKTVLLIQTALMIAWFFPQMSTNGDDAVYYILGRAIADGAGFRDISKPGAPVQAQYPPVYPFFLAVIEKISDSPLLAKVASGFLGVLTTLFVFYYMRRILPPLALPLVMLSGFSCLLCIQSLILMTEVPYLLCTLIALVFLDASRRRPQSRPLFWVCIAASLLPIHCRSIGLAFSLAYSAANLIDRRYRYACWHLGLAVFTIVAFKAATTFDNPYWLQLIQRSSYDPEAGFATLNEMLLRVMVNLRVYASAIMMRSLLPLPLPQAGATVVSLAITVLVLLGWVRTLAVSSLRLIGIYLPLYFGILMLWQTQWSGERFVAPVVPFVMMCLLLGLDVLISFSARAVKGNAPLRALADTAPFLPRTLRITRWALVVVVVVANVFVGFRGGTEPYTLSRDWVSYYSCADWIRTNTPPDAVVVSRKPELFYMRSNRRGLVYPFSHDVDRIIAFFKANQVRYIVFDNFAWSQTTARYLYPVLISRPDLFRTVYALNEPLTLVLEFTQ